MANVGLTKGEPLLGSHRDVCQHLRWGVAHKENINFDKPLNNILKVINGCMHIFCLVSIKYHRIRIMILKYNQFFTDLLYEP